MILLGVIGSLAGLTLASPISIGAGLVFGTKHFRDDRRRRAEMRRRDARAIVQQFLRQVQVELGTAAHQMVQERRRCVRDHLGRAVSELEAAYSESVRSLTEALGLEQSQREARIAELDRRLRAISSVRDAAGGVP